MSMNDNTQAHEPLMVGVGSANRDQFGASLSGLGDTEAAQYARRVCDLFLATARDRFRKP
jgi:hypothetical protein